MASKQRRSAERASTRPQGGAITAHPLFPAIVALWFAALFGLGSLAIRPALIEGMVLASGLDTLVPAAAPPLGVTARMLIAVAMGVLGAVIGAVLARRLSRPAGSSAASAAPPRRKPHAARSAAPRAEPAPARPFHAPPASPDDGDEGDDFRAAPAFPGRRRALAIEIESSRDGEDAVPLPGGAPQILDISAFALDDDDAVDAYSWQRKDAPAPFAASVDPAPAAADVPANPVDPHAEVAVIRARTAPLSAAPAVPDEPPVPADLMPPPRRSGVFALADAAPPLFAESAAGSPPVRRQRFTLPTGSAAERIAGADLEALSHVELIERLAISLQRRRATATAAMPQAPAVAVAPPEPVAPVSVAATPADPAPVEPAPVIASFGRLGAIRREPPVDASPAFAAAEPDPAHISMPAAFRPLAFDAPGDDDGDEDFLAHVPARKIPMPAILADEPVAADDASDPAEDDGYASLVEMTVANTPPRQPLIRIEEPEVADDAIEPVVVFPGQGPRTAPFAVPSPSPFGESPVLRQFDPPGTAGVPHRAAPSPAPINDPGEAERALRSALATLQRMNGAA